MKKICLSIIIIAIGLVITIRCGAQSAKPEKVYSIVKIHKSAEWYKEQSELWKKETDKDPKNANAWYNYYKAMRYYNMTTDSVSGDFKASISKKLVDIMNQMEKEVPNSYEFNLLKYDNAVFDFSLFPYLRKAYDMDPERIDAYPSLAAYYGNVNDTNNLKIIMNKWYLTNDFSEGFLDINYNTLMPLEKNAILIVNGDNIVYPEWVLQYVKGIRRDVKIILVCLFQVDSYRERIFNEMEIEPFKKNLNDFNNDERKYDQAMAEYIAQHVKGRPVYFSNTLDDYYLKNIKDNLYNEGLVSKYSIEKYDNIAILKRNYEKIFFKDYLSYNFTNDISQPIVNNINLYYVPAFLSLYEHYKASDDNDKAKEIMSRIYTIVGKTAYKDKYLEYIKEELKEE